MRDLGARDYREKGGKRLIKEYQKIHWILAHQIESLIAELFGECGEELQKQRKRITRRQWNHIPSALADVLRE